MSDEKKVKTLSLNVEYQTCADFTSKKHWIFKHNDTFSDTNTGCNQNDKTAKFKRLHNFRIIGLTILIQNKIFSKISMITPQMQCKNCIHNMKTIDNEDFSENFCRFYNKVFEEEKHLGYTF